MEKLVPKEGGIQCKLDYLSTRQDFRALLKAEVAKRRLVLRDVECCVRNLYRECSKNSHGNDRVIEIRHLDFTKNEVAALASFFELQNTWSSPLAWKEVNV